MNSSRHRQAILRRAACSLAPASLFLLSTASASTTIDRNYRFGDDPQENAVVGLPVGQASVLPNHTLDSASQGSYFDLLQTGGPTYANTRASGRPGAGLTEKGIQFNASSSQYLSGTGFGSPREGGALALPAITNYPDNRIMQVWARPTIDTGARQDIVNDTFQFGIHITAGDTWGHTYGGSLGFGNAFDTAAPVAYNQWNHIMQQTLGAEGVIVYVNGVAVQRLTANYNTTTQQGNNRNIYVGTGVGATGSFFTGQLDNLKIAVYGNFTASNPPVNWGTLNLGADNEFIASRNLVAGDANVDGLVNGDGSGPAASDDVTFLTTHWMAERRVNGFLTGDLLSRTSNGDLNFDGITDRLDFDILASNHPAGLGLLARQWGGPHLGNWNTDANWSGGLQPSSARREAARITNNTTAQLSSPADFDISDLLLGQAAGEIGGLLISNGGHLNVVTSPPRGGLVDVGIVGQGNLAVIGGGTLTAVGLSSGGASASSITLGDLSGRVAHVTVSGATTLRRTTTVLGSNLDFSTGQLTLTSESILVADIRHKRLHSPLKSQTTASVAGTLRPLFGGITPVLGSKWTLLEANSISGNFDAVDLSAAPPLRPGLRYDVLRSTSGTREQRHLSVVSQAYDGFDYSSSGPALPAVAGGSGFSGSWAAAPGRTSAGFDVPPGSLLSGGWMVDGNRLSASALLLGQSGGLVRALSQPLSAATRYLSFVVRPEGTLHQGMVNGYFGLYLDGTGTDVFFGKPGGGAIDRFVVEDAGGTGQHPSTVRPVVGQEYLLVLRTDFNFLGNLDRFTLYVNPQPGGAEPLSGTPKTDSDLGIVNSLVISATGAFSIDEIRIGTDYSDVVPRPGVDRIWNVDANGNSGVASNWVGGAPGDIDDRIFFGPVITANRTVSVDGPFTAGSLTFDDNNNYILQGANTIQLQVTSARPRIEVKNVNGAGTHTISTRLQLVSSTDIAVAAGASLTLSGQLSLAAGQSITRTGPGSLTISGPQAHAANTSLIAREGVSRLNSNLGVSMALRVENTAQVILGADQDLRELLITTTDAGLQRLDLATPATAGAFRSLRIHATDLAVTRTYLHSLIRSAILNPTDGIYDSGLSAHANAALGLAQVGGMILIRPTRRGDLNLDGTVTIADFIDLASHFNTSGATWQEGDLNYDNQVTISDFIDLASNFNTSYSGEVFSISPDDQQTLASFAAAHGVSVPEPASFALLAMAPFLRRRKVR